MSAAEEEGTKQRFSGIYCIHFAIVTLATTSWSSSTGWQLK